MKYLMMFSAGLLISYTLSVKPALAEWSQEVIDGNLMELSESFGHKFTEENIAKIKNEA